ncbi:MAG: S9 family peptidase, partial [Bacteroidales bacterium]|nr:S9 family peptidase [Bacteroidales bacterium]
MRKERILLMSSALIAASAVTTQARINYPDPPRLDTVDTYFGTPVADPYRWLEDDRSSETEAWVNAQNKVTQNYLSKIPFRK